MYTHISLSFDFMSRNEAHRPQTPYLSLILSGYIPLISIVSSSAWKQRFAAGVVLTSAGRGPSINNVLLNVVLNVQSHPTFAPYNYRCIKRLQY